jgi:exopolysaccharide production protein ExoY
MSEYSYKLDIAPAHLHQNSFRNAVGVGPDERHGDRRVPIGGSVKRVIDIVIASVALILLAPIIMIVAGLIRLLLGGPVVFAQERIGFDGKTFTCLKFRTMVLNGEEVLSRHIERDPEAAREWMMSQKLLNDPRVTCLGNILRRSSLDELLQLWNVLRGEMSLVGPRPVLSEELEHRYGRHAGQYLKARPGLTGIWQTSGRNRLRYSSRVARDVYYVRHWSLWLDLATLIKTIPAVLKFKDTA